MASAVIELGGWYLYHTRQFNNLFAAPMVAAPRTNPYVRTDGWDEEVAKINAKKHKAA